ncbi:MAG TPA: IclR family transcriptional regulator [Solirubrobacteraceae bacterium]
MAERRKPTLVSGLILIERLAQSRTGESVSNLAQSIGMDVGQAHRLLASLVETGYAFQDKLSSNYLLTPRLVHIAAAMVRDNDLVIASREIMRELRDATGETVHIAAAPGGTLPVCVARELSLEPVSVASNVGEIFAFESSAIGEAVAQAHADNSLATHFTIDEGRHRPGVIAVAAPILGWGDEVVGAIAISGPAYRLTQERIAELGSLTTDASHAISRKLGHEPNVTEVNDA